MHTPRRFLIAIILLVTTMRAQSSLEVIAAYYGTDRSFLDVTAIVRTQAQPEGLGLTVGTSALGGDPFPGQLKTLRIYYKLSGQFQQGEWKDSENIAIGRVNSGGRNTGMRGGGRPVFRPTVSAPLTITQATYGAGNRTVDVTSLLQSRVQRDQLDFDVPGTLLGDPAPGLLKELVVSYQWNGQTREARVRDGERLRLPVDQVTAPAPVPVATGLKIVSAQYGSGTRVTDVTALLASRIAADRLVVLVENNNLGGDPARGADKVLNVVYEWNGQRLNASAKEGQTLRLPPDTAASGQAASVRTPTNGVCLYPGQNFQGTPFCAELGQDQARLTGTWGSLRLFGTARQVDLFETANFTGRTVRLTAELGDLSRAGGGFFSGPAPWATTPASFRLSQ